LGEHFGKEDLRKERIDCLSVIEFEPEEKTRVFFLTVLNIKVTNWSF
jgi:hypothetical protein